MTEANDPSQTFGGSAPTSPASPTGPGFGFRFHGKTAEYFRIWIVNFGLTIATLGIYSAWAKVRTRKYLYGNTELAGHRFDYTARPIDILKGRLVALVMVALYYGVSTFFPTAGIALLAVLALFVPFLIVTSMSFQLRNTTYRNIRFRFVRDFAAAYRTAATPIVILLGVAGLLYLANEFSGGLDWLADSANAEAEDGEELTALDLFVAFFFFAIYPFVPWFDFLRVRFVVDHSQFGDLEARFGETVGSFYWLYFASFCVGMGMILMLALAFGIGAASMGAAGLITEDGEGMGAFGALIVFLLVLGYVGLIFAASAYFRVRQRNLVYGNIRFGDVGLNSHLEFGRYAWITLTNFLAIVLSLGLLVPWATIRMARYTASRTSLDPVDLDSVVASIDDASSALGDEIGEIFDLDFGL